MHPAAATALVEFDLAEAQLDSGWRGQALALAAALARGGVFVTADERYVRRASRAGRVVSLRRWRRHQDVTALVGEGGHVWRAAPA